MTKTAIKKACLLISYIERRLSLTCVNQSLVDITAVSVSLPNMGRNVQVKEV